MPGLSDLKGHGLVLAVIDGRFLPIHEFDIAIDQSVEQVQTFGGSNFAVKSVDQSLAVTLYTGRPPHARPKEVREIRLYNGKYEALFQDTHITDSGFDEEIGEYGIEAASLSFELSER